MELNMNEHSASSLNQVTFLSKYLALTFFIILPFVGGWIGYAYAPEKVVEVERIVERTTPKEESDGSKDLIHSSSTSFTFTSFQDIPPNSEVADEILALYRKNDPKNLSGTFKWGTPLPYFTVTATEISRTTDPDCEYGCKPNVITRLDYYTSSLTGWLKFYSEEVEVGNIQKVTYLLLEDTDDSGKFRFIQNINRGFCCDGGGSISNRLFEVDLVGRRTTVINI